MIANHYLYQWQKKHIWDYIHFFHYRTASLTTTIKEENIMTSSPKASEQQLKFIIIWIIFIIPRLEITLEEAQLHFLTICITSLPLTKASERIVQKETLNRSKDKYDNAKYSIYTSVSWGSPEKLVQTPF